MYYTQRNKLVMELFSFWIEVKSVETFDKNHTFDKNSWVILLLFLAAVCMKTVWSNPVGVVANLWTSAEFMCWSQIDVSE